MRLPDPAPDLRVGEWLAREIDGRPILHLLRLACLTHDVAKPRTAVERDGRLRFPRHGPAGAELLAGRLAALGFAPASTAFVTDMVREHLRPGEFARSWPPGDPALRRFARDVAGQTLPLCCCSWRTAWPRAARPTDASISSGTWPSSATSRGARRRPRQPRPPADAIAPPPILGA